MRPTFLGFETARQGVMAAQKALDITGQNISNVNTKGYTRQRLDVFSMVTPTGGIRYSGTKVSCAGQGVYSAGISQIRDPFLDRRFRELNSDTAEAGIKTGVLTDVENVLDNIDTDGIQKVLSKFQSSLSSFATNSTDRKEMANIVAQSAKQLVNAFNSYDTKLQQIEDQTAFEIDTSVTDINATIDKIAALNKQIVNSYVGAGEISMNLVGDYTVSATYGPNELLDARNVLIDSLSTYGDINVDPQDDGSVTIKFAGATVVDGSTSNKLTVDSSTGAFTGVFDDGTVFAPESGSLKGYFEMYNGNGCYATGTQNSTEGIPYYRSVINEFAASIAAEFNAMNVDTSDPLVPRPLFVSSDGISPVDAGNIRIKQTWLDDPMTIIPTTQDGTLDNAHIMRLLSVFDKDVTFGTMGDFTGTFEGYIFNYTNKLSGEIKFQSGKYDSSLTLTTDILNERDATSSVSLDEEGINMMNYQKWYNASARLMTTLDEALNTIINSMGLVGR